ncbi:unnamed protein product [Calypogeia fissa]
MESLDQLKVENERLNAEVERQTAELASKKKKIKLAMKKQQAELQAKIQAAEQRAAAAEAAAGAASGNSDAISESNSQIQQTPQSPEQGMLRANGTTASVSSSSASLSRSGSNGETVLDHPPGQRANGNSMNSQNQASVDSLVAELAAERQRSLKRENGVVKEKERLENEVIELRKTKDTAVKQRDEARANFEEELKLVKEDAEQRLGQMMKANEKLEAQLLEAAGQVADAFTRMSATHDDMERISKEGFETKRAHSTLLTEHNSVCQELEQCRAALAEAQNRLLDKAKEMEEMAAARKSAQEGQEAAMSQLMSRLDEMEAAGTGHQAEHLRELNEDKVQSLLQEKADLLKDLEKSTEAISILREELTASKDLLRSVETIPQSVDLKNVDDVDKTIADMKLEHERLLEELRSQTNSLQQEVDELRKGGQQADPAAVKELSLLTEQLEDSKLGQQAAENQIKRLSVACSEAENKVITITQELADALRKLDDEIKSRDDKYAELDAKFGRLQKRAKQRIQEVQKEKEEVETQLTASSEKAAEALSKQAALQDELERVRHQTSEALRSLDAERQQLQAANIKLTEEVEDLRRTLDGKEHNLAESRRLASEKDQSALELTATLKEAEANHGSLLLDVKEKHRKVEENLSAQLADAISEIKKMAETISALQAQIGVRESKFAGLEAATSGEMVRLGASLEAVKGELSNLELKHKKDQEQWEASIERLRRRLEETENAVQKKTVAAAEMRSQSESELERQRQLFSVAQADLSAAKKETSRVAGEFAAYKVRANSVLQKKEAELLAAKDSELAAAQERALKQAKDEAIVAAMERDGALKALQDSVAEYEDKLAVRDRSVLDAEQRIRDTATKLEASKGQLLAEQEEMQKRLDKIEETWRLKYDALEENVKSSVEADLKHEYTALMTDYKNLKVEFETFHDLVDTMVEEKDKEIARLLEDNAAFQRPSVLQAQVQNDVQNVQAQDLQDMDSGAVQVAEQQILLLARQQAQREEEVTQCRRHIQVLQEEIVDLEHENRLHSQQEALLKEELRNLERAHKRDGVDMTYLKNVILKLLETGEVEALLPVVAMLLQFSPEELKRCHDTYSTANANNVPLSGTAAVGDAATVSTPRTFFSRLTFTGGS